MINLKNINFLLIPLNIFFWNFDQKNGGNPTMIIFKTHFILSTMLTKYFNNKLWQNDAVFQNGPNFGTKFSYNLKDQERKSLRAFDFFLLLKKIICLMGQWA